MSDASVRAALRSDERLVVIEAPAGCGKTHQGADYVLDIAGVGQGRVLILTHTHAACSVFAERTRRIGSRVEIRTIDGLIGQVAGAYHLGLGLPADTATWARRNKDGYAHLAAMVSAHGAPADDCRGARPSLPNDDYPTSRRRRPYRRKSP